MSIDLYQATISPPCLAVVLGAKVIGVPLNLKELDIFADEHKKPQYAKMNPQKTVPILNDNGFTLGESRVILGYLSDKYAKDDSLYPKDPKKRAVVDQILHFDIGTFYLTYHEYYFPTGYPKVTTRNPRFLTKFEDAFETLNRFLDDGEWVAGSNFTIADIAIATTVAMSLVTEFPLDKYPIVSTWFEKCKKMIPSYEELTREPCKLLREYYELGNK